MASLNKISLLGRVGNDPDVRYSPQNPDEPIASFSIATGGDKYKDKNGQEQVTETQWHNCTAFKGLGKVVANYVKKGTQIYVDGKMRYEKYTDKNGVEKTTAKVIVDNVILLGSKNDNANNANLNNGMPNVAGFAMPQNNGFVNQQQATPQYQQNGGQQFQNQNMPPQQMNNNNFNNNYMQQQQNNYGNNAPDADIPF